MGSVFSALMRGLLGVVGTLLVVAIVWTLYLKRDAVLAASEPLVEMVLERQPAATQGTPTEASTLAPQAAGSDADAPVVGALVEGQTPAKEGMSSDSSAVAPAAAGSDSDPASGKQ